MDNLCRFLTNYFKPIQKNNEIMGLKRIKTVSNFLKYCYNQTISINGAKEVYIIRGEFNTQSLNATLKYINAANEAQFVSYTQPIEAFEVNDDEY